MKKDFEPVEARVNAKINIGLQIVRKRPDGYHDLQTVFIPTDFYTDTLELLPHSGDLLFDVKSAEDLGDPYNNLCVKAYRLLQCDYGIEGVEIRVPFAAERLWYFQCGDISAQGDSFGCGIGRGVRGCRFHAQDASRHFPTVRF